MSYDPIVGGTTVDCHKQLRSWRLLRSIFELLIPSCIITQQNQEFNQKKLYSHKLTKPYCMSTSNITGTLFGSRRGKVRFCIQTNPKSISPILLLELAITTSVLAKEMKGRSIRIAFECNPEKNRYSGFLLSMPLWRMYFNGRKVGFAVKRKPSRDDIEVLQQMETVVVGAGIRRLDEDIVYLRGKFEKFHGSANSESFHLIDPDDNINQELSFYFLRSYC
ncbi:hypothetical protein BUALT_Bualt04G0028200 [Buddleja alternifolia]|uniref:Protein MIZU-KUSSEI 1-like n=1 Tax=Buddleja alternifolia TaxID=168488 RepID=A0AAV6XKU4_9LAMI|nr:hypothetical protein BUALT_Bualt04G0028200 [Buddleja alternifolia]